RQRGGDDGRVHVLHEQGDRHDQRHDAMRRWGHPMSEPWTRVAWVPEPTRGAAGNLRLHRSWQSSTEGLGIAHGACYRPAPTQKRAVIRAGNLVPRSFRVPTFGVPQAELANG